MAVRAAPTLSAQCRRLAPASSLGAQAALPGYQFVCKTDVAQYYASIDHSVLLAQLDKDITSRFIWRLLCQFLKRTVHSGGHFRTINKGISRGCALSPVIAAYYLKSLDQHFARQPQVFYRRYMDDIILLCKTRWHLRKAVKALNQSFKQHGLRQAPDKTFIGKISRGFDFLGYHFSPSALGLANKTLEKARACSHKLYEQKKPPARKR